MLLHINTRLAYMVIGYFALVFAIMMIGCKRENYDHDDASIAGGANVAQSEAADAAENYSNETKNADGDDGALEEEKEIDKGFRDFEEYDGYGAFVEDLPKPLGGNARIKWADIEKRFKAAKEKRDDVKKKADNLHFAEKVDLDHYFTNTKHDNFFIDLDHHAEDKLEKYFSDDFRDENDQNSNQVWSKESQEISEPKVMQIMTQNKGICEEMCRAHAKCRFWNFDLHNAFQTAYAKMDGEKRKFCWLWLNTQPKQDDMANYSPRFSGFDHSKDV